MTLTENVKNVVEENIQEQLIRFQNRLCYDRIADLLTFSLKNYSSELNRQVFGYIPSLFREVAVENPLAGINSAQLPIGEPVVLKISFPANHTIRGIPFFYLFCYIKENSTHLNVYFQSAAKISNPLSQKQYTIAKKKITFEGVVSAFTGQESTICISDPGHFIPGLNSSFYVGTKQINFANLISDIIESICDTAQIELRNTFLFGSSAGGMGALLSSTYFSSKVQVLSVNSQIITYDLTKVMKTFLETSDRHTLLKKFSARVSCLNRFQQNINSTPNIYLLANINDSLHQRNFKFYQLYQQLFVAQGQENQSIFDSYCGVEGHGRPNKASLKKKIEIAKESLMMRSNLPDQLSSSPTKLDLKVPASIRQNQQDIHQLDQANLSGSISPSIISYSKLLESNYQIESRSSQSNKSIQVSSGKVDSEAIARLQPGFLNSINIEQNNSFDAYISLGDNCEAGLQFLRIGYKESSFFRFTSANFNTTFNIIKNNFNDVFNQEYIIPRPKCEKMVLNKKYGIAFHSKLSSKIEQNGTQKFATAYNFAEVFQNETSKIDYLISKWNQMMSSERRIMFLLKNDSEHKHISQNMANKLCRLLLKKYKNHNFQILCLQLDKFKEPQWENPYLINRYFPYFAPRVSAKNGSIDSWDQIFAEFPLKASK